MGKSDYKMSVQDGYVLVERPENYEVVANELPAMLTDLSTFCDKAGCQKALVLGPKTKVDLALLEIYDLGSDLAELHLQIAMVESHDASDEDVSFLENVVANRGGPIRFFNTEKEAKNWLGIS